MTGPAGRSTLSAGPSGPVDTPIRTPLFPSRWRSAAADPRPETPPGELVEKPTDQAHGQARATPPTPPVSRP